MSWLLVSCLQNVWPYFVAIEMLVSKIVYNLCRKHFPAFSSTLLKDRRSTWGKVPTCIPHGSLCKPGSKINGLFCFSHCSLSLHFWWCLCSPKTLSHLVWQGAFTNTNAFGRFAHTVGMKILRPVLLSPDPLLLVL